MDIIVDFKKLFSFALCLVHFFRFSPPFISLFWVPSYIGDALDVFHLPSRCVLCPFPRCCGPPPLPLAPPGCPLWPASAGSLALWLLIGFSQWEAQQDTEDWKRVRSGHVFPQLLSCSSSNPLSRATAPGWHPSPQPIFSGSGNRSLPLLRQA